MKKLFLILVLVLLPSSTWAQCTGVFPPNTLCGNLSGVPAPPSAVSAGGTVVGPGSSVIDDIATWNNTSGTLLKDSGVAISNVPTLTGTSNNFNPAGLGDSISITQNLSGAPHYGLKITETATGNLGPFNYNLIEVTSDNAQCGAAGFCNILGIQTRFGGAATIGGRQGIQSEVTLATATSPSNTNQNYVGGFFSSKAQANDNGTNTGAGARGAVFGINSVALLEAGATNFLQVSGGEIDMGMDSTASAKYMIGWSVVSGYNGEQDGAGTATGIGAGFNVSGGVVSQILDSAYIISDINGSWPIKVTGSLQSAFITAGTPTVANGTDWSSVLFTGCSFKSSNFCIDNNGHVIAPIIAISSNSGGVSSPIGTIKNTHNTAGDWGLLLAVGPTGTDNASSLVVFEDSAITGAIGSIGRSGTGVVYNTTSDVRRKANIKYSAKGIDDLMKIKVRDFNFIDREGLVPGNVNGLIAQELQPIYPEAVTIGGDDPWHQPWGVDYGRITPLIIKSIQDMQHEINDLRSATR